MKCRACWADVAEVRRAPRWKAWLAVCVLSVPVRCRHCYYEFFAPLWTIGTEQSPQADEARASTQSRAASRKAA